MTKTTADLRILTIAELRTEAAAMNSRLRADPNDAVAYFAFDRIEAEVRRRQRLCCAVSADGHACVLLIDHSGNHRSLTERRSFTTEA